MQAGNIAEGAKLVVVGLVAALLPWPERDGFAQRHGVDPSLYSLLLGLAETVGGVLGIVFGGLSWMQGTVGKQGMILLSNWFPGLSTTHIMGVGLLNGLAWLLHPLCWLLIMVALTGVARLAAFVASGQAVGEPLVWVALRTGQAFGRGQRKLSRARELGPLRADRTHYDAAGRLIIISSRDRPEWTPTITLLFEEKFFRLADRATVRDGDHHAVRYVFTPLASSAVIRGLLPYQPLRTDGQ